ncbi:hypothetical protein [Streptomyces noursei]
MTPTSETLITNEYDLRAWLDTHPSRHAKQPNGSCACGWPGIPDALMGAWNESTIFPDQVQHAQDTLISELGSRLPSDTTNIAPGEPHNTPSWRTLTHDLYRQLATCQAEPHPPYAALIAHLVATGTPIATLVHITGDDPRTLERLAGNN